MLKGKTTIELTDVNTGEKKVYEDHNMVTNALNSIFKNYGYLKDPYEMFGCKNSNSGIYPFYKKALGGILLFDNEIVPNDGNTIFAPANTNMVGCGVYNVTSTNNARGSYNPSESYYNSSEKTMKYVYDFATNQANGTIKSVCLTSAKGGYASYGHNALSGSSSGDYFGIGINISNSGQNLYNFYSSSEFAFLIDLDGGFLYRAAVTSTTNVKIKKYRTSFNSIRLFDNPLSPYLIEQTDYEVSLNSTTYVYYCYDHDKNELYVCSHSDVSLQNGKSLKINKINLNDNTVEKYSYTNNTGFMLWLPSIGIYNRFLYAFKWDSPYGYYKIDLSGETETKLIGKTFTGSYDNYTGTSPIIMNGRIFMFHRNSSDYARILVYNPETDTAGYTESVLPNSVPYIIPCIGANDTILAIPYTRSGGYVCFNSKSNYLATINNLETPITKTNTNTMKIIYTIQET